MEINRLKNILEAVLLAADNSLNVIQLEALFDLDEERPSRDEIRKALHEMADDYEGRGYELKQVASGFRLQVRQEFATWVGRLWEEKPARYTRALLETMALIAYRQPITRGEIEEVRGVSVSSNIIKTLLERDWIKVLGHKDVPGKPALYGTTREFLDYFNLKSLDQLPTLAEIKDLDSIHPELELDENGEKKQDDANSGEGEEGDGTQDDNTASAAEEQMEARSPDAVQEDDHEADLEAEQVDGDAVATAEAPEAAPEADPEAGEAADTAETSAIADSSEPHNEEVSAEADSGEEEQQSTKAHTAFNV